MIKPIKKIYITLLLASGLFAIWWLAPDSEVDFNTQIRPIFNQKCMACHGGVKNNAGLSLRFRDEALQAHDSEKRTIVPGKPRDSELIRRISHTDPEIRMPAEEEALTDAEIKLFNRWIKQGAKWDTHWSYVNPDATLRPPQSNSDWALNGIDQFVYQKLQSKKLGPAPPADKATVLRRVSLDLIGLPPTLAEAQHFLNDGSVDAYEKLVDRLLASPHFGERWAAMWLDLARYADSQGYHTDFLRPDIWRYRDWVIDAFNKDIPFDQFTIEQLAGDLLPEPTSDQLLATAFHRNSMTNDEGGTDNEEFRIAAVQDRVTTTFEIWQGATIACVQCHSHPYDPYQHEEFYKLFAFFNSTADADLRDGSPVRYLLSPAQKRKKQQLQVSLDKYKAKGDSLSEAYVRDLKSFLNIKPGKITVMRELPADSSRKTHVFERGNWLVHGKEVQPATPSFLPKMNTKIKPDRLALAKWLLSPENPLTARVVVNRFWEQLFGIGLVETLEDFGTQGTPPSHKELLDWLALQFQHEHQWSVKALLRQIVLSATYRQSSRISPNLLEKDPYNRLFGRGPRVRLSAEQIRDQALMASGLFSSKMYGPSVMPYQPEEAQWNIVQHRNKWELSEKEDRYRRAIYTFWRRVSPYPSMVLFDSPSRELCTSRRISTNTPLQALITLNDPVYTEAAEALAMRMASEGGSILEDKIRFGFRLLLLHSPSEEQLQKLLDFYKKTLSAYKMQKDEVKRFVKNEDYQTPEMAALTNLASVILNLDEVIMKG